MMAGDRNDEWLHRLFVTHHLAVLAYARRRVPDVADEVVAEVFATAWRQRSIVPDPPLPWLYATARHEVLHQQRSHARRQRLLDRLADQPAQEAESGTDIDGRIDASRQVRRMLARLPERDAEVLRLWAWEGLDGAQLAAVLGCSPAAARVRLHRAKRRAAPLLELTTISELLALTPILGDLR